MILDEVTLQVQQHIAQQFLGGEDPASFTDDVKLVSDGVFDSPASLRLVAFIEERFGVKIEAHEVDVDHLDTISSIADLVRSKRA